MHASTFHWIELSTQTYAGSDRFSLPRYKMCMSDLHGDPCFVCSPTVSKLTSSQTDTE